MRQWNQDKAAIRASRMARKARRSATRADRSERNALTHKVIFQFFENMKWLNS